MFGLTSYLYGTLVLLLAYRGSFALAIGLVSLYAALRWFDHIILDATTAVLDLPYVGKQLGRPKLSGTAVICGSAIGGTLTARVLAQHFERVILIDDEWQEGDDKVKRTHVMQYQRLHALSSFVTKFLERLFPEVDVEQEVRALNGRLTNFADTPCVAIDGAKMNFGKKSVFRFVTLTRPTFETWIRKRVLAAASNIEVVWGRVTALQLDDMQQDRISQVDVALRDGQKTTIDAALVIDASGATSAGQKWLHRLGYQMPTTTTYNPNLPYVDFSFHLSQAEWDALPEPPTVPKAELGCLGMSVGRPCDGPASFAIVFRYEPQQAGDAAMIQIAFGTHTTDLDSPYLPQNPQDLLECMQQTQAGPYALACMEHFAKCERWSMEKSIVNRCTRVNYDKLTRLPHNFVAIGDATGRLNPTFGQGITQASRNVVTLNRLVYNLRSAGRTKIPQGFGLQCLKKILKRNDALNDSNHLRDAMWSSYEGEKRPNTNSPLAKFIGSFIQASHTDKVCAHTFVQMTNGFVSPLSIFTPEMIGRVAWARLIQIL